MGMIMEPTDPKEVQKHLTVTDVQARLIAAAWDNHIDSLRILGHLNNPRTEFETFIGAYFYGWTVGHLEQQLKKP